MAALLDAVSVVEEGDDDAAQLHPSLAAGSSPPNLRVTEYAACFARAARWTTARRNALAVLRGTLNRRGRSSRIDGDEIGAAVVGAGLRGRVRPANRTPPRANERPARSPRKRRTSSSARRFARLRRRRRRARTTRRDAVVLANFARRRRPGLARAGRVPTRRLAGRPSSPEVLSAVAETNATIPRTRRRRTTRRRRLSTRRPFSRRGRGRRRRVGPRGPRRRGARLARRDDVRLRAVAALAPWTGVPPASRELFRVARDAMRLSAREGDVFDDWRRSSSSAESRPVGRPRRRKRRPRGPLRRRRESPLRRRESSPRSRRGREGRRRRRDAPGRRGITDARRRAAGAASLIGCGRRSRAGAWSSARACMFAWCAAFAARGADATVDATFAERLRETLADAAAATSRRPGPPARSGRREA